MCTIWWLPLLFFTTIHQFRKNDPSQDMHADLTKDITIHRKYLNVERNLHTFTPFDFSFYIYRVIRKRIFCRRLVRSVVLLIAHEGFCMFSICWLLWNKLIRWGGRESACRAITSGKLLNFFFFFFWRWVLMRFILQAQILLSNEIAVTNAYKCST